MQADFSRPEAIGPLRSGELREAALVLARAFRDNPLNVAVIGSGDPARRLRCNAHGMRSLLPVALRRGRVLAARDGPALAGALVFAPPGGHPLPAPPIASRLRCLLGQGWRVARRWAEVFDALDALHPEEPHWYLGTLGVEPRLQGRGHGARLLQCWLAQTDGTGEFAYLETDTARNVSFYASAGFEVEAQTEVLGTPVWRMRRPARGAPPRAGAGPAGPA